MRKRFIPPHHKRDLLNKLQSLTQGSKSVEEYNNEMELALLRASVVEDENSKMAYFLNRLNKNISDLLELHDYNTFEELLQKALKAEKQLKKAPQIVRANQPAPLWQRNQSNNRFQGGSNSNNTDGEKWKTQPSFQGGNVKKFNQQTSSKVTTSNSTSNSNTNKSSSSI